MKLSSSVEALNCGSNGSVSPGTARAHTSVLIVTAMNATMLLLHLSASMPNAAAPASKATVIRAPLTVVDGVGRPLLRVSEGKDHGVMDLLDSRGKPAVRFGASKEGGTFTMFRDGVRTGELASSLAGGQIVLLTEKGERGIFLGNAEGLPILTMRHRRVGRAYLGVDINDDSMLRLFARDGNTRVTAVGQDDGGSVSVQRGASRRDGSASLTPTKPE